MGEREKGKKNEIENLQDCGMSTTTTTTTKQPVQPDRNYTSALSCNEKLSHKNYSLFQLVGHGMQPEIEIIAVCIPVWRNLDRGFAAAYYIWLDAERREEFNSSGIIFRA